MFNEKETRLYELNELEEEVNRSSNLVLESAEVFRYERYFDMEALIHQAENHHYSTFSLYDKDEFDRSVLGFRQNLKSNFGETDKVKWTDENSLLTIKKMS